MGDRHVAFVDAEGGPQPREHASASATTTASSNTATAATTTATLAACCWAEQMPKRGEPRRRRELIWVAGAQPLANPLIERCHLRMSCAWHRPAVANRRRAVRIATATTAAGVRGAVVGGGRHS